MLSTMMVDLDHLLANPIYQEDRCSINFHPLHTYYAIAVYIIMIFFRKPLNIIGIGLLLHMLTDFIDCIIQNYIFEKIQLGFFLKNPTAT